MRNLLYSRMAAWIAMIVIVCIIILTFSIRPYWWTFIDEFFAFMAVFCQLIATYTYKINTYAAKKLQVFAAVFGVLMILSLIGEYIVYTIIIP